MANRSSEMTVSGNAAATHGLRDEEQPELVARASRLSDVAGVSRLVRFVASYLVESGRVLRDGETVAYGTWLLKAVRAGEFLELHEFEPRTQGFVPTISSAVRLREQQDQKCREHGLVCDPPTFHQKVAISEGYEQPGVVLEGVRYHAPPHMSGWYITTDSFSGNVGELRGIHAWHVVAHARPEVGGLLGLPAGSRFRVERDGQVTAWFDEKVASESA
ncbi:MAG: hypothetical protein HYV09_24840 [Deltaproteobacteria bacterium]|nr:hypothetical protein [Deltaproteobacteria bacterium]